MITKLVRDKIPDLILAEGGNPVVTFDPDGSDRHLIAKFHEEANELDAAMLVTEEVEELADLLEVWRASVAARGLSLRAVIRRANAKRREKGGFDQGVLLEVPDPVPAGMRWAYYPEVMGDVVVIRTMLEARGYNVADGDIALAYSNYSELNRAIGWMELERVLEGDRDKFIRELVANLEEVPS